MSWESDLQERNSDLCCDLGIDNFVKSSEETLYSPELLFLLSCLTKTISLHSENDSSIFANLMIIILG
jgi:hypothetical protein